MKKLLFTAILALMLFLLFSFSCYAWVPSYEFTCYIDYLQIPEDAVYVDLLLPISPDNENYTEYNTYNGETFSISQQSEIVEYNNNGYMSYTFHIKNATSEIKPYFTLNAECNTTFYNNNKELFKKFVSAQPNIIEELTHFYALIYLGSEEEIAVTQVYNMLNYSIENEKEYTRTNFFVFNSNFEEFYNFCQNYKTAKMAYLNANGDIISVSNEIPITEKDVFKREPLINIELKGNTLTSEFSYGPPVFVIGYLLCFILIAALITVIIVLTVYFAKRRKAKKI